MNFVTAAFAVVVVFSNTVQADTLLRFIFNNNVTEPGKSCSAVADSDRLGEIFDVPDVPNRSLRQGRYDTRNKKYQVDFLDEPQENDVFDTAVEGAANINHRNLPASYAYCRNHCERYVKGYCRVVGCGWFNKGRRNLQSGNYGLGVLSNTTWCSDTAAYINNELDRLIDLNLVSEPCQALLDSPRTIQCYTETIYGLVETFNLYNADTDQAIKTAMGAGYQVCSGTRINFEVKANACVNNLKVIVNNTDGSFHRQSYGEVLPVTLFPKNGSDYLGQILPNGNYTITGVPDGDMSKQRWRRFFVAPC
jgi:hypothetical protein